MQPQVAAALIALLGVALGSLISSLNSYFSWRRERHKFATDRLWEARRDTYSLIMTAIARLERLTSEIAFGYTDEGGGYDGFHQGKRHVDLSAQIQLKYDEYVQLINASQLVMTRRMDDRVFQLMNDIAAHTHAEMSAEEWATEQHKIYSLAERDVLAIGKSDLGIADR